jgi:para-aminobenzoate synthetase component 1
MVEDMYFCTYVNMHASLIRQLNAAGKAGRPFFLFTDFELVKPQLYYVDELAEKQITVTFPSFSNMPAKAFSPVAVSVLPGLGMSDYAERFKRVKAGLHYGNSYLTNLTMATPVALQGDWMDVFYAAQAKYKIAFQDQWICFSPEMFIRIRGTQITTYPMKGTIDADLPNAAELLMHDEKEIAEHYTIVDLLRNDLSKVAHEVEVLRFRYLETLHTSSKNLLQCSSEITGELPADWRAQVGDILFSLLPAGSVSGAPKQATCAIINEAEAGPRGYYTGVAFYFDGENLDSTVMIRFIERTSDGIVYRSGGGITIHSDVEKEYQELLDKIYVPGI